MHPDYEYDFDLHKTAQTLARTSLDQLDHTTFASEVLARAYLDLLERRGMPPTLKCYPSIQLQSGGFFDFAEPQNTPISPEDIAVGLSKSARCTGHSLGFEPYTIAQHCCLASDAAAEAFKFEALMHDAPEAVLGDVTTPLKQLMPDYKKLEERVTDAFAGWFDLPKSMSPEVKVIDIRMAATEKRDIMPPGEWEMLRGIDPYDFEIEIWGHERAYHEWILRFYSLNPIKINWAISSAVHSL